MFPVRVAVETVRAQHCLTCAHDGHVLVDTYAIVSGTTSLNQLVETVLSALGHPNLAANARGMVQVNNWKALPFDQITDNQEETVHNLFKDISSHITLRILTKPTTDSASTQCINELKQKLLKTAVNKNPNILNTVDNQQIKDLINQIIAGDDPALLNHDQINAINEWLDTLDNGLERRSPIAGNRFNQLFEIPRLEKWFKNNPNPSKQQMNNYLAQLNASPYRKNNSKITYQQESRIDGGSDSPSPADDEMHSNSDEANTDTYAISKQEVEESSASSPDMSASVRESLASSSPKMLNMDFGGTSVSTNQSSTNSNVSSSARSRLMFDPLSELPVLEKWFEENPHPTWMQIDQYTQCLNSCPYRENYPHISQHNVKVRCL
ncbi:unnamed protein product [Caenorhabditis bovis]|uniref:CMP domain-containing protein n=1 Tax=Caenorhabditis bovis TaxID=2654633 RepID=A0A8S1EGT0_9PELO|nr:unnamed protein product [Caenorhabditis bovis]